MNKLPSGESSFNYLFSSYKNNARARGLSFSISKKKFRELTKLPCSYCGIEPSQKCFQYNRKGKVSSPYIYNGVDRTDNNRGYYPDNVTSCCGLCNNAKKSLTLEEFKAWIKRLVKYNAQPERTRNKSGGTKFGNNLEQQ